MILINSQDYQYGQYIKCLVQLLETGNELHVRNGPLFPRNVPPGLAGMIVVHPDFNPGDPYPDVKSWDPSVPCVIISHNGFKAKNGTNVIALCRPLDVLGFVQSLNKLWLPRIQEDALPEQVPKGPFLIGSSPQIESLRRTIAKVAKSDLSVLICGQTGTGKGVAAMSLHNNSYYRDNQFMYLNCANVPNELLESELFGYKKGAFTGAWQDKPGRFQQAREGTIFLDEISEMSPYMQAKLLHVLQEKEFYPVGGTSSIQIRSRIIAATNADLHKAIENGSFREDLYYRLAVVRLDLPPLRERKQDIPLLIQYFLDKFRIQYCKPDCPGPSRELHRLLRVYDWPGNVRELESCINSVVAMESEEIVLKSLFQKIPSQPDLLDKEKRDDSRELEPGPDGKLCLKEAVDREVSRAEAEAIKKALQQSGGRKKIAAQALKTSYKSLLKKIKEYGL